MTESLEQVRAWIVDSLPRLRRLARALTLRNEAADDLVHASIARALSDEARPSPDLPLNRWMLGTLCSVWSETPARELADDSPLDATRTAMLKLPHEERVAVALVLIEGLSYKEAAEALAIPVDIMTARLTRGREALQALL